MKRFLIKVITGYYENNLRVFSAYASFYIIVSAIPFLAVLFFILSSLTPSLSSELDALLLAVLPSDIFGHFQRILSSVRQNPLSAFVPFSILTAIWGSTKGVSGLCFGIKRIFNKSDKGNFIVRSLKSLWRTFLFYLLIISTLTVFALGRLVFAYAQSYHIILSLALEVLINLRLVIFAVVLTLLFTLLYSKMGEDKSFLKYLPGGAFASVMWMLFTYFYSIYIGISLNRLSIYAEMGTVIFFMLWCYFCLNIILIGAEIDKALARD